VVTKIIVVYAMTRKKQALISCGKNEGFFDIKAAGKNNY
jgi:hypothetical protein